MYIYIFDDGNSDLRIEKPYSDVEDYIKSGYVEEISVINHKSLQAYIIGDSAAKVIDKPLAEGARLKVETTIGSIDNFDNFIRQQRESEDGSVGLFAYAKEKYGDYAKKQRSGIFGF